MSNQKGLESQRIVIKAIEEYTDRHSSNQNVAENGINDMNTLTKCDPKTLVAVFNSSMDFGLTTEQVKANQAIYGRNQYRKRKKVTLCEIFKEAISDEMLIILMISAAVSIIVEYFAGEQKQLFWVDGASILMAVVVCSLVATISNYQKEQQFTELDEMTQSTYNYEVIRDGKRTSIHRSQIVPGDMLLIANGMEIPADCLVYKAVNIHVNESAVTGESVQLQKNTFQKCSQHGIDLHGATPYMISGSSVVSGEGVMMAVVIGKQSQAGKHFELIFSKDDQDEDNQTPLQRKLQDLGTKIGYFGITSAILIFAVLVFRHVLQQLQHGSFSLKESLPTIVSYLIIAVTVIVMAVPQGLPLAVTLTLAYSMKAMHQDKILVRQLASCETMGAARYICSDKTGTITQNKMNVMQVVNFESIPIQQFNAKTINPKFLQTLTNGIFHNSSAVVQSQKGPQTQIALLKVARNLTGKDQQVVRQRFGIDNYFKRLPFDSSRKRMTTGLNVDHQNIVYMTGASQQILQACNNIQNYRTNQISNLTNQTRDKIIHELQSMAKRGLRTVSIAYKPLDESKMMRSNKSELKSNFKQNANDHIEEIQRSNFILLGVFGIEDPPRPQSKQAIQRCKKAGIRVIMVTGDNKITATSISKQVGIIAQSGQEHKVMEAAQLMKLLEQKGILKEPRADQQSSQNQKQKSNKSIPHSIHQIKKIHFDNDQQKQVFQKILDNLSVLSRSKPEHKYILVDGINKLDHVVAVTGDGSNDAPALMRADIGLAMGVTGTQVAKNASDIVLLDDNFSSIVRSVVWGRNVYLSIRKFLQFQLTVSVVAVSLTLISAGIIKQSVFTAVQMLWVNMIMDSLAALALATQPPNAEQLLNQKPNSPNEKFITKTMLKHIIGQAILQVGILFFLLFVGPKIIPQFKDQYDEVIGSDLQAKYYNGIAEGTIADGKYYTISGENNYLQWFKKYHNYSRHFTLLFNTFVFLQVFNFVCCRKIKDQLFIFKDITKSGIFCAIFILIVVLQILMVTFGGRYFQFYRYYGLTITQWVISVGIAVLTIPFTLFLRVLPFWGPQSEQQQPGLKETSKQGYLAVKQ